MSTGVKGTFIGIVVVALLMGTCNQVGNVTAKNAQGHEQFFSYANTNTSGYFTDNTGAIIKQFTNAFSNCQVPSSVHTAVIGIAEKQDATYVKEAYYTYDSNGHVTDTKTSFGSYTTWIPYSGTFNEYTGDTSFLIDLTGHTVTGNGVLKVTGLESDILYEETHSKDCPSGGCSSCNWPNGNWSGKYYSVQYSYCCGKFPNYDCDEGWLSVGPFTHYPGTLGYHSSYIPNLNQDTQWFPVTTYWRAYPAQVKYNMNNSAWTTISTNLKNNTTKIAVPGLTNGENTLNFSESSSKQTTFSWELYVPVDSTPDVYTTSMTYDVYGNMTSVTDAQSNTITFSYASDYAHAYLTEISATAGTETITTKASYDYYRGWVTSTQEPKGVAESGYDTVYTYDVLGRIIKKEFPLLDGQSERSYIEAVYDCENRTVTIIDILGHYTVKEFDKLGRLTATKVYTGQFGQGTLYATKSYKYYYNDKVKTVTDPGNDTRTYTYDFLGRNTHITFSDSSVVSYSYDDTNSTMTFTNSRDYKRKYWFNWVGQLTKVEEEYEPGIFTQTVYQYDESGHVTSFTDAESHTTSYEYTSLFGLTKVVYPDLSYEEFHYDDMGNLVSATDGKGDTTTYIYDSLYQLIQIQYQDASTVSFSYDLNGNKIRMDDNAPNTGDYAEYEFDAWNRPKTETRHSAQGVYTVSYQYDEASRLTNLTYPNGMQIMYAYDDLNRIIQVKKYIDGINDEILQDNIQYNTESLPTQFDSGNGLQATFLYDSRDRPLTIDLKDGETQYLSLDYTYDDNSNITQLVNGWRDTSMNWNSDTEVYTYDGLDRLTSATSSLWSHSYSYDKVGNRISKDSTTYTINSVNQLTEVSDGTTFDYDLNGNTIQKTEDLNTWVYTYDSANRLAKVEKNDTIIGEYVYDGNNKRIQATEDNVTTTYVYTGLNVLYEENTNGEAAYIYGPTGRIAKRTTVNNESHTYYYHTDHLGSTRLVTDESKNVVTHTRYEPFGESAESEERYLYTGKEKDSTGLYYYGARYYDPAIGRFITRDPLTGQITNPQSLNRYTYCLDNPVKLIDPTGLLSMCNVDTGVCVRLFEDGNETGWIAYDENGLITTSAEIEGLLDKTDKTKEQIIADQAKAAYLMLLVTHPEIEGDPDPELLDVHFDTGSEYTTWFSFKVSIDGQPAIIHIGIDSRDQKIINGIEYFGEMDEVVLEDPPVREFYIIFYQNAFSSIAALYHVAGHEGQHVVDYMRKNSTSEKSAFGWNAKHDYAPPFYISFPLDRKKYGLPPCPGCP